MGTVPKTVVDDTILITPKPQASSTTAKKPSQQIYDLKKTVLSYTPISPDAQCPERPVIETGSQNVIEKLQLQRMLTKSFIEQSGTAGLPSRFFRTSEVSANSTGLIYNSTISESDLMKHPPGNVSTSSTASVSFVPNDISTPRALRHSTSTLKDVDTMSKQLLELQEQLANSNVSISEICRRSLLLNNDESFVPGELALDKFAADEASWRNRQAPLGGESIASVALTADTDSSRMSMTNFFQKKSEYPDTLLADSPEKDNQPVPLIDESSRCFENSTLSITDIQRAIQSDNTQLMEFLLTNLPQRPPKNLNKENKPPDNLSSAESLMSFAISDGSKSAFTSRSVSPCKFEGDSKPLRELQENRSLSSVRTASSLGNLVDGRLPIESNRTQLVWGCVMVGRSNTQEFVIRNKCNTKISLKAVVNGTNFRILKDHSESEPMSVLPMLLHPRESRSVTVMFMPSAEGKAMERLNFYPISEDLRVQQTKNQCVVLLGYGGHSSISIQNVAKDSTGKMWVSLGELGHKTEVNKHFSVTNNGTLSSFVCLQMGTKGLCGFSNISAYPPEFVLKPRDTVQVVINYTPTKEDIRYLAHASTNDVIEIGSLQVISGAEALRGRIRRICSKLQQKEMTVNELTGRLASTFPNEKIPPDSKTFPESTDALKRLLQELSSKDIVITVEKDPNQIDMLGHLAGIEESSIFQTLCQESLDLTLTESSSATEKQKVVTVEPSNLVFIAPYKTKDTIIITSNCDAVLHYEVRTAPSDLLHIEADAFTVLPRKTTILKLRCNLSKTDKLQVGKVLLYFRDDVFCVNVKVFPVFPESTF